jgi:5-methyltetrahydropteroyltriglutamate--homocysteine methyltransferase
MSRSADRVLVTHTGSLPRPHDLARLLMDREGGQPVDGGELEARVREAVAGVVARQLEAGVDVVNDGEQGKVGYSTYVKHRLTGFEGESVPAVPGDLQDYPELVERRLANPARQRLRMPTCTGPVRRRDGDELERDIANLRSALSGREATSAFMTAASPGVIALFLPNRHYPSYEEYLAAIADAMRAEYRAIVDAGFILQLDCPDLAMGRHYRNPDQSLEEFRRTAALNIEALDHAVAGLPEDRMRLHICWGNYEGPHHRDVPLRDILDIVLRARPAGISVEASNPRHGHEHAVFEEVRLPEAKYLIPGVIDSVSNFVEHPELVAERILRYGRLVGRERVVAGTDCGFGTFVGTSPVVPAVAWAKLRTLAEGARLASARLW